MKKLLFLLFLVINFHHAGLAQTETGKQLTKEGEQAHKDKNHEQAIEIYEPACSLIGKAYGNQHPEYATCLNDLALLYRARGSYAKAESIFLEALQIREKTLGKQHPAYATSLNGLALLYRARGSYAKAEPLLLEALQIKEKTLGKLDSVYVNSLHNLAWLYRDMGSYAKVEPLYVEALQIREKTLGKQHPDYAISLKNLAWLYRDMGSYAKAEPLFLEALQIQEKTLGKQHPAYATFLINLAGLYQAMGSYGQAEPLLLEALQIRGKTLGKERPEYATSLNDLALLYREMGSYAKAEPLLLEALQIRGKTLGKQPPAYATSLSQLALLYWYMASYAKAEPLFLEALQIIEKALGKQHPEYATCLNDLALLFNYMGNYAKAEPLYLEALQIREKTLGKQHPEYATSLNDMALLYRAMGSYGKAEPLFLEALQIRGKTLGKQHPAYANSLNDLALLYREMGSYAQAEPLLLEALQIRGKTLGKQHLAYATSLNDLALLNWSMGSYAKAEPLYLEALQIQEKTLGKQHPAYATSLNNLALLYRDMGSYAQAEPLYLEALQIQEKTLGKQHPAYANSLKNLAWLYWSMGSYAQAEPLFLEVHQNLLGQIKNYFPGLSEKEKSAFYQKNIGHAFEGFHSFALHRQAASPLINDHLYNNLLATKGLVFQSQTKIRNAIFSSGDSSLVKVYQQWQAQRNLLARVYQMSLAQKQQAGIDQAQLEKQVNDLEKQLSTRSEAFAQTADKTLYTWQQVQKALKPGEAAVEMVRFRYYNKKWTTTIYYAALVVTPTSQHPAYILLANGEELETQYTTLYRSTVPGQRDIRPGKVAARHQADAARLYEQFWSPIAGHASLQGVKTIYFSGDGVYHQLNLNTLFNPNAKRYLLDELDIHLVSSTRDLLTRRKISTSLAKATLLGYPAYNDTLVNDQQAADNGVYLTVSREADVERLFSGKLIKELPGTRTEVTGIGQLLRRQKIAVELLTGTQATEAALKQVRNPNILHIATHGFFRNLVEVAAEVYLEKAGFLGMEMTTLAENPLHRSGLLLAGCQSAFASGKRGSSGEDGVLTAYEAMGLNLDQTDLVVLSACETGLGEIRNGEGVYGLQRAFQTAGAKAVLMSLWKVDDAATQQLMSSFYKHWLTQGNARTAFRQAQQDLRRKYPQPYYWGAFVLLGE